jgi:hypothetical protein
MEKLYIPIILGTATEKRQSEKVATFVVNEVRKNKIKINQHWTPHDTN